MNHRVVAVLTVLVLLSSGCVMVQHAPKATERELWVRFQVSHQTHKGALLALDRDSLSVVAWNEPDAAVTVPISAVSALELYRGRNPSAKAALKGAAVGAVLGAAGGGITGLITGAVSGDPGRGLAEGAAVGAGTGLVAGAIAGILEGEDDWQSIEIESLRAIFCGLKNAPSCRLGEPPTPKTQPDSVIARAVPSDANGLGRPRFLRPFQPEFYS